MTEAWPCPACRAPLGRADLLDRPPPEVEVYREPGARYCPKCGAALDLQENLRWTEVALVLLLLFATPVAKNLLFPDTLSKWAWALVYGVAVGGVGAGLKWIVGRRRRLVRFAERGA